MRPLVWALLLCACDASVKKCKDNTLFVSVKLQGDAVNADQLFVDIAVDGGTPVHSELSHSAGKGMGGVQIEFPSGYPKGHFIAVTMTAVTLGSPVASVTKTITLANVCDSMELLLASGANPDLSSVELSSVDLAGADFSDVDLATVDLATLPDLQLPDLTTFVDLLNCMPTSENCFNNVDDDCDGLIDCADPDCTGGGAPIAKCIPDPGGLPFGIELPGAGTCPAPFPSSTPIHSGFVDAVCALGSCSCIQSLTGHCVADLIDYGNGAMDCSASTGTPIHHQIDSANGSCLNFNQIPNGNFHYINPPQWLPDQICNPPTGTPQRTPAHFTNDETFCRRTGPVGSGCLPGNICVPAANKHCVLQPGNQVACPANYNLVATHYFTDVGDDKMCSCGCNYASGGCDAASWLLNDLDCVGDPVAIPTACSNSNLSSWHAMQIAGQTSNGSCYGSFDSTNTGSPKNEQTLCCRP